MIYENILRLKNSDRVVIRDRDHELTGRQLCALIGYLEHRFIEIGITERDFVPCIMGASIESVATIYALGMIGAAYVPISPRAPRARQAYIIEDLRARTVITDQTHLLVGADAQYVLLRKNDANDCIDCIVWEPEVHPSEEHDVAYVIYTSGSTGNPKGVMVSFGNLQAFLLALQSAFPVGEHDRYLLSTDLQFDVSVSEIFGWILGGGSLYVLHSDEQRDIRSLPKLIQRSYATHVASSPSVVATWTERQIEDIACGNLRYLMIAGEEFPVSLARRLVPLLGIKHVYNCYGPTEATVYATIHRVVSEDIDRGTVPIGAALSGMCVILDSDTESPNPELLLSGKQVALGYHGLPKRTALSFHDIAQGRTYATGDAVRMNEQGELVYHGRIDFQMEINSIRVEPGEIESVVSSCSDIRECLVMMIDHVLTCYYVETEGGRLTREQLIERTGATLPEYEVPKRWICLPEFPLTINGKIDRSRLKEIARSSRTSAPADDVHHPLVKALRADLELPPFDYRDNLFELGLDSLRVVQAESVIERYYGRRVDSGFLSAHPSVMSIELAMKREGGEVTECKYIVPMLESYGFSAVSLCEHGRRYLEVDCGDNSSNEFERLRHLFSTMTSSEELTRIQAVRVRDRALFDKNESSVTGVLYGEMNPDDSYSSSIFQKVYAAIHMNSFLDASFTVPHDIDGGRTKRIIAAMIENVEAFRTTLCQRPNGLMSKVWDVACIDAHIRDITLLSPAEQHDAIMCDIAQAQQDILGHLYDHPLVRVLAFRTKACTNVIHVICHHAIADGASVDILRGIARRLQNGASIDLPHMRDYLAVLKLGSEVNDLLVHPHTQMLAALPEDVRRVRSGMIFATNPHVIHDMGGLTNEQYMAYAAHEITARYLQRTRATVVPFQMLFNFRTIRERNFAQLVNDCHETLTFVRREEDDALTFTNALYRHLMQFHYRDGHSTGYAIYKDFPAFSPEQQRLRDIYETAPINIDYIGAVDLQSLSSQIEQIRGLEKSLSGMKRQMRFTVFSCEDCLYIMQVSAL